MLLLSNNWGMRHWAELGNKMLTAAQHWHVCFSMATLGYNAWVSLVTATFCHGNNSTAVVQPDPSSLCEECGLRDKLILINANPLVEPTIPSPSWKGLVFWVALFVTWNEAILHNSGFGARQFSTRGLVHGTAQLKFKKTAKSLASLGITEKDTPNPVQVQVYQQCC